MSDAGVSGAGVSGAGVSGAGVSGAGAAPAGIALVRRFYHDLWNRADPAVAEAILAEDFRFRGSLGPERRGRAGFVDYMLAVHTALGDYTCEIEDLVAGRDAAGAERVTARLLFHGVHRAPFFGVAATGRPVRWAGAAFFTIAGHRIAALWVLGDIDAVKRQLGIGTAGGFD